MRNIHPRLVTISVFQASANASETSEESFISKLMLEKAAWSGSFYLSGRRKQFELRKRPEEIEWLKRMSMTLINKPCRYHNGAQA